ncbi:hypothetical protein AHAS_Ahas15G0120900 [Arachis hypogaea]
MVFLLDEDEKSNSRSDIPKMQIIVCSSVLFIGMMMILCISLILYRRKKNQKNYRNMRGNPEEHQEEELDLPYFDMATLISAINNFSTNNILGKGGFRVVYKVNT